MEFRRIPFQFSTTDPVKRQAELEKRFALPTVKDKMFVDYGNSGAMSAGNKESNSATCSSRLQHRVPLFMHDSVAPPMLSVDSQSNGADNDKKPNVRVVPIEIEGMDNSSKRHRNLSGPSGSVHRPSHNGFWFPNESVINRSPVKTTPSTQNIPIKVEKGYQGKKAAEQNVSIPKSHKNTSGKKIACTVSKPEDTKENKPPELDFSIPLKKIESILEKLKVYEADVEKFSGTTTEKQYRYLDEMLTRCILDLDDVDTMGNESIRLSRKAAVKEVQNCIDRLESKVVRDKDEKSTAMEEMVDELSSAEHLESNVDVDVKAVSSDQEVFMENNKEQSGDVMDQKNNVSDDIEMSDEVAKVSEIIETEDCPNRWDAMDVELSAVTQKGEVVENNPIQCSASSAVSSNFTESCIYAGNMGHCVQASSLVEISQLRNEGTHEPALKQEEMFNCDESNIEMECVELPVVNGNITKGDKTLPSVSNLSSSDCCNQMTSESTCQDQLPIPQSTLSVETNSVTHSAVEDSTDHSSVIGSKLDSKTNINNIHS